jgi:hypothetical protein
VNGACWPDRSQVSIRPGLKSNVTRATALLKLIIMVFVEIIIIKEAVGSAG